MAGFTLAEVLASLLFMAIVVPVAMHGVQVASRAGLTGARSDTAARIAERLMNEVIVTASSQISNQSGRIFEDDLEYEWNLRAQAWNEADLDLITVHVAYQVQGRESEVRLSTLINTSTEVVSLIE